MRAATFGRLAAAAALACTVGLGPALAEDSGPASDDRLSFAIAPYLWATSITGDVGAFGLPSVEVDADVFDVLENLDIAFMALGEVRYGRFGLFMDLIYSDLSSDATPTPGPLFGSAELESEMLLFTPMLEYRIVEDGGSSLDAMAGIRVWSSETELDLSGGLLHGRTFSDEATWVDPTIGAKGHLELDGNWALNGWGIIGGFGAGSHFMWDAFGGVAYQLADWASLNAGYRATGVDYDEDGYVLDIIMHGPIFGAVFRF